MSIIVKSMKMPQACMYCPMFNGIGCNTTMKMFDELTNVAVRVQGCPLVEFPEKHGRLIDADAFIKHLEKEFADGYEKDQKSDSDMKMLIAKMHELIITEIRKRPTVIESEE